jgi:hypothetical protein
MSVLACVGLPGYPLGADRLSLTARFSGVAERSRTANRFSGFSRALETAEAVRDFNSCSLTPLKRGVNERPKRDSPWIS